MKESLDAGGENFRNSDLSDRSGKWSLLGGGKKDSVVEEA